MKTLLPHGIENRCAAVESHLMTSLAQSVGHRQEGIQVGSQRPYGQEKSGQANANNTRSLRRQPVQYQTQDRLVPMGWPARARFAAISLVSGLLR